MRQGTTGTTIPDTVCCAFGFSFPQHAMHTSWSAQPLIDFAPHRGEKYIAPEKAGPRQEAMNALRARAQAARQCFGQLAEHFATAVAHQSPGGALLQMDRVSHWMNQAQIARPHFWVYFNHPDDPPGQPGIALRLFGGTTLADTGRGTSDTDDSRLPGAGHAKTGSDISRVTPLGISVEISCIERKRSGQTLALQNRVLMVPIQPPLYYHVQRQSGADYERIDGAEANRLQLQQDLGAGRLRKVLVKYDVPDMARFPRLDDLTAALQQGLHAVWPHHEATRPDRGT
ncbi:MAG: hypothetical protein Q4D19_04160 [Lautropia sp.]|nr:hypothetical protein [Lautropia sp.]